MELVVYGTAQVHVRCQGGTYRFSEFCAECPAGGRGRNFLIVFNTAETITIEGSDSGRQWFGSIFAPHAHIIVDGSVGFVDGQVHADEGLKLVCFPVRGGGG